MMKLRRRLRCIFSARLGGDPGRGMRPADENRGTALPVHLAPEAEQGAGELVLRRLGETARPGGVEDGAPARRDVGVHSRFLVGRSQMAGPEQNHHSMSTRACSHAVRASARDRALARGEGGGERETGGGMTSATGRFIDL